MDQGGLNLISVPSKKAAGGKRQFLSKFFLLPFVSRLCAESGWQMSPTFLHFELQKRGTMSSFCTDSVALCVGKGAVTRM